jgi:hypothetical protein
MELGKDEYAGRFEYRVISLIRDPMAKAETVDEKYT